MEDFVDFARVFASTRLFICNGGYGSIMLALSNGVPILAAGKREGKNDINARIDYFRVGVDLRTERPSRPSDREGGPPDRWQRPLRGPRRHRCATSCSAFDPLDLIMRELVARSPGQST